MKLVQKKILAVSLNSDKVAVIDGIRGSFDTSEDDLNAAKMLISNNTTGTTKADVYKMLLKKVRALNGQCVSNAWLKFMEIFKFIESSICKNGLNVFMNAELPGAAICALNHFMKNRNINYTWTASSFMPVSGKAQLEDRYGLLECNPENWLIRSTETGSEEFTGDMTDSKQVKICIDLYKQKNNGRCDLYTSDAGMDVSSNYAGQEEMNFKLHLGCAIVGLSCISLGGTLICKHYTFYQDSSKALLWYYQQFFETVTLMKPVTSRPYNSETYVVGINFMMPENGETLLAEMFNILDNNESCETTNVISNRAAEVTANDRFQMFHDIFVGRQIEFLREKASMDSDTVHGKNTVCGKNTGIKIDTRLYDRACNFWLSNMGIKEIASDDHLTIKK